MNATEGTTSPPPRSSAFHINMRENPVYFGGGDFGIFSNPETAGLVSPEQALEDLGHVARSVREASGVKDSKSARRKRRSFREIVTNSLTRKRSGIKNVYRSPSRKGKKDRALSEDAAATSSLAEEEEDEEEERSAVTRSVSLDPASVSVRLRTATMSSVLSSSPPAYQNESVFGTARPPKPPDRTASLPEPEIQPQQQQTRAGKDPSRRLLHKVCPRPHGHRQPGDVDIVIVYSRRCEVSSEWATYFARGYNVPGNRRTVHHQMVEEFSELPHSTEAAEERTAHAGVQLVLVSPEFLTWVSRYAHMVPGRLLVPVKLIALMVGVRENDVKEEEHRRALITFQQWRKIPVETNDSEFALRTFREITALLDLRLNGSLRRARASSEPSSSLLGPATKFTVRPKQVSRDQRQIYVFLQRRIRSSMMSSSPCIQIQVSMSASSDSSRSPPFCIFQLREGEDLRWINDMSLEVALPAKAFVDGGNCCNVDIKAGEHYLGRAALAVKKSEEQQTLGGGLLKTVLSGAGPESVLGCSNEELDRNLARHVEEQFGHLFGDVTREKEQLNGFSDIAGRKEQHFPSLLHFAAFHGLERAFGKLLSIPGARDAASKVENCSGLNAFQLAELGGHQALLASAGCEEELHYIIPNVSEVYEAETTLNRSMPGSPSASNYYNEEMFVYDVPRSHSNPERGEMATKSSYIPMLPSKRFTGGAVAVISGLQKGISVSDGNVADEDGGIRRPRSRQEVIDAYVHYKVVSGATRPVPVVRRKDESQELKELPLLGAFSPLPSTPPTRLLHTPPPPTTSSASFSQVQAELIEMQRDCKSSVTTMTEAEEKFSEWKGRPETALAAEGRQAEVEAMREEWLRLQLAADDRSSSTVQIRPLLL